jgi:hypothetical protein
MEEQDFQQEAGEENGAQPAAFTQNAAGASAESILQRARQKFSEVQEDRRLEIAIPGFGGELVAVFKPLDFEFQRRQVIRTQRSQDPRRELWMACDSLADSCVGIYGKDILGDGHLVTLTDGQVPRFDIYLVDIFPEIGDSNDPNLSARKVIRKVFINDLAVMAAYQNLSDWTAGSAGDAQEVFSGEVR